MHFLDFIYIRDIYNRNKRKEKENIMIAATNPFANYTLAIAAQYEDTVTGIMETQKKPPRKVYKSMDKMLEECFFLGATKFGTNFIA